MRDITERKRAENELLKALAREKELGELKSNFVSMVSHEFRTPLGVIMSASEILQRYLDRLPPEKRTHHLQSIFTATQNLSRLVEEVLLLGKAEDGKMKFNPAPISLLTLCRLLADEVMSATNRQCPIQVTASSGVDGAQGDENLLRHIMTNLLTNAVKYSEPGKRVDVTVERNHQYAVFHIRDQGIGIPPEDQPTVFDSFYRGRNVGHRPGTGLGLVIVKSCVKLHHGDIRLESKLGEGTTVIVRLPMFA